MKKYFIVFGFCIIGLVLITGCIDEQSEEQTSYIDVSAMEAKELIDTKPDLIIIDVSPNYENGHIPGAVNYYIGDGSLDAAIPMLDMNKEYLVYCHVDSASIGGAQKLIDAGFTMVYRLEGNYQAWIDAGYPIE
jgi:rhodanese-related sulfurtransferase